MKETKQQRINDLAWELCDLIMNRENEGNLEEVLKATIRTIPQKIKE